MDQIQVLSVDLDFDTAESVGSALEATGLAVHHVDCADDALEFLAAESVDCIVSKWLLSDSASFVESVRSRVPTVPVIWFTDQPAATVAETLSYERVDYVHDQHSAGTDTVVANRIRSAVSGASSSLTPTTDREASEQIVDRSHAGILVFDAAGTITRLNPAAEQLLGLSAADAIGNSCETLDMRTPDDQSIPLVDRPVARVLDSGESVVDQLVSLPADDGRRWLSISASPLADGQTVDGVVVTLEDVSAEVELETTLETVLNRMTDGFIAFDTDLRLTYFSDQALNTDRYPSEQYLGATLSELHPQLARYEDDLEEVLETQESATVETYIPDPTDGWFRARLYPSETGVSVFFREITDEKQREHELEQYKTVVESVQDGVCILDSAFDFVFVNEAFTELTGYSEADLLGSNASLITDPADMEAVSDQRERLLAGDTEATMLTGEITTADEKRLPIEAWMTPLRLTDGEQGTVSVVRDVSFRRDTEAMFTALYDGAHDLLSARTEQTIADIGVEAAASALDFEDAILFSYDEATNVFRPLAHTPSAEVNFSGMPSIDASSTSISGRAFFESEPIATADMSKLPAVYDPETPYRRAIFTPIGEHGVLFVGDTEIGPTSEQTLTVAELLGATVAAAFSRLSFEERSVTHRETLAERTAELAARTHTNDLVSELVDHLFSATTREEVEAAVCSVLAGFDKYRFAWIGTGENRTDRIMPRDSAGHDGGYLDWLAEHVDSQGHPKIAEPAYRALETNAIVSVDRLTTLRLRLLRPQPPRSVPSNRFESLPNNPTRHCSRQRFRAPFSPKRSSTVARFRHGLPLTETDSGLS